MRLGVVSSSRCVVVVTSACICRGLGLYVVILKCHGGCRGVVMSWWSCWYRDVLWVTMVVVQRRCTQQHITQHTMN